MASVIREITIAAPPAAVWDALADFGRVHERLVPGFVTEAHPGPDDRTRVVTFFTGAVARERLVGADASARRLAYTVEDGPLGATHHNASAQVLDDGAGGSRFVWITDVLPDALAEPVGALMDRGIEVIRRTLGSVPGAAAAPR